MMSALETYRERIAQQRNTTLAAILGATIAINVVISGLCGYVGGRVAVGQIMLQVTEAAAVAVHEIATSTSPFDER